MKNQKFRKYGFATHLALAFALSGSLVATQAFALSPITNMEHPVLLQPDGSVLLRQHLTKDLKSDRNRGTIKERELGGKYYE